MRRAVTVALLFVLMGGYIAASDRWGESSAIAGNHDGPAGIGGAACAGLPSHAELTAALTRHIADL